MIEEEVVAGYRDRISLLSKAALKSLFTYVSVFVHGKDTEDIELLLLLLPEPPSFDSQKSDGTKGR